MVALSGTAADFDDLWTKFVDHITNDPTLTNAGENWTQAWNSGNSYVFTGPGSAGADTICVGIEKVKDSASQIFEWNIRGMTHVVANATSLSGHANPTPHDVRIMLADMQMPYWLSVSGRRIILVVKISTYYEVFYGGFFLPYLTPSEYPYPLFIGGSAGERKTDSSSSSPFKWSDDVDGHTNFLFTDEYSPSSSYGRRTSGHAIGPDGQWHVFDHAGTSSLWQWVFWPTYNGYRLGRQPASLIDWSGSPKNPIYAPDLIERSRQALGGGPNAHPGWPAVLMQRDGAAVHGQLDGVYRVSADNVSAESTITVDGQTCIVFPNIWRTGAKDMWAMKHA